MKKRNGTNSGGARITTNPAVCGGAPCIRGTRIPVYVILGYLSAGSSIRSLLKSYPTLTVEDVRACLAYAAKRMERPVRVS